SDGNAEAPWQQGPGEIWRVTPQSVAHLVLRGPMSAGIALSPAGTLFVADRQASVVFAVTPDGRSIELATFTHRDAPRRSVFAPPPPATRQAGFAGALFVVVIRRGAWPVNEVLRVSGPFDEYVRQRVTATR